MNSKMFWHWFAGLEKITTQQKTALLKIKNSPKEIFDMGEKELSSCGYFKKETIEYIETHKNLDEAKKSVEFCNKEGIVLITILDHEYPNDLKDLYLPPVYLFAKGDIGLLGNPLKFGVVGSRNPTLQGEKNSFNFSKGLSQLGFTMISGLATGIDAACHCGSISENGSTIGVLGTGIDIRYPRTNEKLYDQMEEKGLLITEFNLGEKPLPYHFPLRNRIISGLSQGVLIIEAKKKSGSLITANCALDQGKNVYVIPGEINKSHSFGGNQLLKDGAKLVTEINDILEDFVIPGEELTPKNNRSESTRDKLEFTDSEEKEIYDMIEKGYSNIDEIALISGREIKKVNCILTLLEIKEYVTVKYGNVTIT
ncbi:MAG: DNA-processing protein DprA [Eubacteriaceae bacterium]